MRRFFNKWGVPLALSLISISALVVIVWLNILVFGGADDPDNAVIVQSVQTSNTQRLDRDLADARAVLKTMESEAGTLPQTCERCRFLLQGAQTYQTKATSLLEDIRRLEIAISAPAEAVSVAERNSLFRNLAIRQKEAGRTISGLVAFSEAVTECEDEQLCRRDDEKRAAATEPLNCERDQSSISASVTRITELAQAIVAEAKVCQSYACPMMDCDRSQGLADDLAIVEMSLAELAGGRTALPGLSVASPPTGLATVLGSVERGLVGLAAQSAEQTPDAETLYARAEDMKAGLQHWLSETESRSGVQENSWRVSALMGEIDVAAEWARAGDDVDFTRAYFQSLARAILSAARLNAALATTALNQTDPVSHGPICGASELGTAYLSVGQARAALSFCQARSACAVQQSGAQQTHIRSSASRGIGALAAVTGALPLDQSRARDAAVREAPTIDLSFARESYKVGEVIRVRADTRGAACVANNGAIALVRAGSPARGVQRYLLAGNAAQDIMLAAPTEPGRYAVRIFASADRGGGVLRDEIIRVEPLSTGCHGFSGLWETEFGRMYVTERENEVTGSYRRTVETPLPGLFVGQRQGNELTGTWLSELGRGGARLRLLEEGKRFKGTWGTMPDRLDGGGSWNGSCLGFRH